MTQTSPLTIGIVAGEVSGDALGADFMQKMNALHPHIHWVGVGGEAMAQAGLDSIFEMSRLSVMGLVEVIKHLPDLLAAKQEIVDAFLVQHIDLFVGIDAPDFNLRIGKALKKRSHKSIFCVQYVSPSIWAWRESRITTIKAATDLVLCLFPFELDVYKKHKHPAICVGHPLLHKLDPSPLTQEENYQLFLQMFGQELTHLETFNHPHVRPICVMAGSRLSEIQAMLPTMIKTMQQLQAQGDFCYIMPVVSQAHKTLIDDQLHAIAPDLLSKTHIVTAQTTDTLTISQYAMNACQLTLLASGTATFEALLLHRPMVVIYKVSTLTYAIAKQLIKIPYYALPNILSYNQTGKPIVPELIQKDANASNITKHILDVLNHTDEQLTNLQHTTKTLRRDSHTNPAQAVLTLFFDSQSLFELT